MGNQVEYCPHISGPPQKFLGIRGWGLAGEHGRLLVAVTAGVAGQKHWRPMAGQVLGPAQETFWRIPEPMGDHHLRQANGALGAHHFYLQDPVAARNWNFYNTGLDCLGTWAQLVG
jgi:hypothetical protein